MGLFDIFSSGGFNTTSPDSKEGKLRKSLLDQKTKDEAELKRRSARSAKVNLAGLRDTSSSTELKATSAGLGPQSISALTGSGPQQISALSSASPLANAAETPQDAERQRKVEAGQAADLEAAKKRRRSALAGVDSFKASQERAQKSLLR